MAAGVLRARKDGKGCSICHAKPENVGKRKCCHVMSGANMTIKKIDGTNFVNISGKVNGENTEDVNNINKYVKNTLSYLLKKYEKDKEQEEDMLEEK